MTEKAWVRTTPDRGYRLCPTCEGRGWCEHCDGTGRALFDNKTRCAWCAGLGECPICEGSGQLSQDHDAFRGQQARSNDEFLVVRAEDAAAHGLAPLAIYVDAKAAGLFARPFPSDGVYVALNGPPGGTIVLAVWDASNVAGDLESVVRAKLVPPWTQAVDVGSRDHAAVLGEKREGVTFATGTGIARVGWFGFVLQHQAGRALVACGISWRSADPISAKAVLAHPSIAKAIETLVLRGGREN